LNAFKLEFDGIPGDFDEAEDYGLNEDASGNENVCNVLFGNTNGNGNGFLSGYLNAGDIPGGFNGELPNYFIHLSNSGLINDGIVRMDPDTLNCNGYITAGINFPAMPVGDGLIIVSNFTNKKLYYVLGGFGGTRHYAFFRQMEERTDGIAGNLMTAREAKRIEAKIDDENPLRGISKVIMYYAGGTFAYDRNDNDTNCVYNSEYNVGYDENACTLAIEVGKF
jgi:hypothetical protein